MLKDELPEIVTGTVPGPKAKELLDRRNAAVPKALCGSTYPICIARGEGAMIEDLDGNKFLDWIGGVGVLNMGYSRPEVVEAVKEQAGKYFHTIFNVVVHDGYVALAEKFNQTIPCRGDKKKHILPTRVPRLTRTQSRLRRRTQEDRMWYVSPVLSTEEPTLQWHLRPRRHIHSAWDLSRQEFTEQIIHICTEHLRDIPKRKQSNITLIKYINFLTSQHRHRMWHV